MIQLSEEAIVEAMKNDLGVSRVDDLKLENGRKGHAIRVDAIHALATSSLAVKPPKKPHNPMANKWLTAIKKGEFDDDDAEAVKGLDRIGGGRLHALNSQRQPGPGPLVNPRQLNELVRFVSSKSSSTPSGGRTMSQHNESNNARSAQYTPVRRPPLLNTAITFGSPVRQHPPVGQSSPVAQPLPAERPSVPFVPELEPTAYFHKADIRVADRLAKGSGMAYLLEDAQTDCGTFSIFLEGIKYLEYPISAMVNYLANSQELCPQFKEADGVSITTTSLVFTGQSEIALFMRKVRELQARLPAVAPMPASTKKAPSTPKNHSASSSVSGMRGTGNASASLGGARSPMPPVSAVKPQTMATRPRPAVGAMQDKAPNSLAVDKQRGPVTPTPVARESGVVTMDKTPQSKAIELVSSLVDLYPPQDVAPPKSQSSCGRMSSYAMDLYSLESIVDSNVPPPFSEVESLTRDIQEMLPIFERASRLLASIGEDSREDTAKKVYANLKGVFGSKELLRTLFVASGTPKAKAPVKVQEKVLEETRTTTLSASRGPRYSPQELFHLRSNATKAPDWLSCIKHLPRSGKPATAQSGSGEDNGASRPTTSRIGASVRAKAQDSGSMAGLMAAFLAIDATPAAAEGSKLADPSGPATDAKETSDVGTTTGIAKKGLTSSRWA